MITPQAHIDIGYKTEVVFFKTYRNHLLKELPKLFAKYGVSTITVIRSKRGQWGEWFERWTVDYRQEPYIVKSGWN